MIDQRQTYIFLFSAWSIEWRLFIFQSWKIRINLRKPINFSKTTTKWETPGLCYYQISIRVMETCRLPGQERKNNRDKFFYNCKIDLPHFREINREMRYLGRILPILYCSFWRTFKKAKQNIVFPYEIDSIQTENNSGFYIERNVCANYFYLSEKDSGECFHYTTCHI